MDDKKLKELFRKIICNEGFSLEPGDWEEYEVEYDIIKDMPSEEQIRVTTLLAKERIKEKKCRKYQHKRPDGLDYEDYEIWLRDDLGNTYTFRPRKIFFRFRKFTDEENDNSGPDKFTEPVDL